MSLRPTQTAGGTSNASAGDLVFACDVNLGFSTGDPEWAAFFRDHGWRTERSPLQRARLAISRKQRGLERAGDRGLALAGRYRIADGDDGLSRPCQ